MFVFLPVENIVWQQCNCAWKKRRKKHDLLARKVPRSPHQNDHEGHWGYRASQKKLTLWKPSAHMPPPGGTSKGGAWSQLQQGYRLYNRVILKLSFFSLCASHSAFLHAITFKQWRESELGNFLIFQTTSPHSQPKIENNQEFNDHTF